MADHSVTIVRHLKAEPELRRVYARMGFKPHKAAIPEAMQPTVQEAINLGRQLLEPRACFALCALTESEEGKLHLGGAFLIESRKVCDWMRGCAGLYLTAVTVGPQLDEKVGELSRAGDVTGAFLLNAYGAEAAEALMEELHRQIALTETARGRAVTKRYSPGYGDWPIMAQRDLLSYLEAEKIGIHLTESYLMIPEKSVSAIIGVRQGK